VFSQAGFTGQVPADRPGARSAASGRQRHDIVFATPTSASTLSTVAALRLLRPGGRLRQRAWADEGANLRTATRKPHRRRVAELVFADDSPCPCSPPMRPARGRQTRGLSPLGLQAPANQRNSSLVPKPVPPPSAPRHPLRPSSPGDIKVRPRPERELAGRALW
jgi:hypothetical protein